MACPPFTIDLWVGPSLCDGSDSILKQSGFIFMVPSVTLLIPTTTVSDTSTGTTTLTTIPAGVTFPVTVQTGAGWQNAFSAAFASKFPSIPPPSNCSTTYFPAFTSNTTICKHVVHAATGNSPITQSPISATNSSSSGSRQPSNTSSTNPWPIPNQEKDDRKFSKGAVIGAAIGCFIAGISLAAIILFFLARRKGSKPRDRRQGTGYVDKEMGPQKKLETSAVLAEGSVINGSAAGILENGLPQPADDPTLSNSFSSLGERISGHIQSYYNVNASVDVDAIAKAMAFALESSNQPTADSYQRLSQLLSRPRYRTAVLRHALGSLILARIRLECESSFSFLPLAMSVGIQGMPRNHFSQQVDSALFNRWRTMTSHLLRNETFDPNNPAATDPRADNIRQAAEAANTFLQPFAESIASKPERDTRMSNLESIMFRAARLGLLLASQPSVYSFDWQTSTSNTLTILPALVQVIDESGKALEKPRVLVDKVVFSL